MIKITENSRIILHDFVVEEVLDPLSTKDPQEYVAHYVTLCDLNRRHQLTNEQAKERILMEQNIWLIKFLGTTPIGQRLAKWIDIDIKS